MTRRAFARSRTASSRGGGADYTYSLGLGLWGYHDINLDESKAFTLAHEDRPFFGEPAGLWV